MAIKKVWLVNKYAMPPKYESRLRTIKFAHYLQQMGYEVIIFGGSVMHNMNIDLIVDDAQYINKEYDDLNFVHVKSLPYKETAGIKRIISEIKFHYDLVKVMKNMPKADVIIATTDALISNPVLNFAKENGIKYIKEVLDMWPDIFSDMGLISPSNPIMKYLLWKAKRNYTIADASVFSLTGCFDYFRSKKWDKAQGGTIDLKKIFYINNGVDLKDFDKWKTQYIIDDIDLLSNKKKIIYIGSIRMMNNIFQLVKAAERLKERTDTEFLIYGDGDDRNHLIEYCKAHKLNNVKFKAKWTDPKYIPFILSQSHINILNYINSDFAKYGISSSKMFQYMASGKPIVCNINLPACPITSNNIGIAREFKDDLDYAKAIEAILDMSELEYDDMCQRAKETAKSFDYETLTKQMVDIFTKIET